MLQSSTFNTCLCNKNLGNLLHSIFSLFIFSLRKVRNRRKSLRGNLSPCLPTAVKEDPILHSKASRLSKRQCSWVCVREKQRRNASPTLLAFIFLLVCCHPFLRASETMTTTTPDREKAALLALFLSFTAEREKKERGERERNSRGCRRIDSIESHKNTASGEKERDKDWRLKKRFSMWDLRNKESISPLNV